MFKIMCITVTQLYMCDLVDLSIIGLLRIFSLILHMHDCIYLCQSFYL